MAINYDQMRPCIKDFLLKGQREKAPKELFQETRRKMTYRIIHDLHRIGIDRADIKQQLLQWNNQCICRLSSGDAKRQLCDYVDWFFKEKRKLSCNGLKDYCSHPEGTGCRFQKKAKLKPLTYRLGDARIYLEHNFPKHGEGFRMGNVLEALHRVREEKGFDELFVGLRTLSAVLYDIRSMQIGNKELLILLHRLEEENFIRIKKGKKGNFGFRHSNAYTFLDWKEPPDNA